MSKDVGQKILMQSREKRFPAIFDPLNFLSANLPREILLLESADIVTKQGEKSILLTDLALKIEGAQNTVKVTALMREAQPLISLLSQHFADRIMTLSSDMTTISTPGIGDESDLTQKMRMPCALDIFRAITSWIKPQKNYEKALMFAGVFSYDFIDHFEILDPAQKDTHVLPDFLFYLPLSVVVIDHPGRSCTVYAHGIGEIPHERLANISDQVQQAIADFRPPGNNFVKKNIVKKNFSVDIEDHDFARLVIECKDYIKRGEVYQIVPSRTFFSPIKNAQESYRALRSLNPSPYMFFVNTAQWTLFGASPETYIKVDQDGRRMSIRPIAGTRLRGLRENGDVDDEQDMREQVSLCLDEKELAEHMMLVDLARNDVASVCVGKSRKVKKLMSVDRFSHVMHLVSQVEGTLLPEFDALSAYQASINMGTLMGAPKVRAAQILRQIESSKRGFYGGAVGYIDFSGDMDTAIIIRSALVKDGQAFIRVGCGVVYDSDPELETQETTNKAQSVLRAIEIAESL